MPNADVQTTESVGTWTWKTPPRPVHIRHLRSIPLTPTSLGTQPHEVDTQAGDGSGGVPRNVDTQEGTQGWEPGPALCGRRSYGRTEPKAAQRHRTCKRNPGLFAGSLMLKMPRTKMSAGDRGYSPNIVLALNGLQFVADLGHCGAAVGSISPAPQDDLLHALRDPLRVQLGPLPSEE